MRSESRTRIALDQSREVQSLASSTRSEIAEFMVRESQDSGLRVRSGDESERKGWGGQRW